MRRSNNSKLCPILSAKIMAQSREELPVIIQFNKDISGLKENISNLYTKVKSNLSLIDAFAGNMTTDMIYRLSSSPDVDYISFDSKVYTLLDIATPTMEAYFPHEQGFQGEGITIAVIDTGVAPHDDLIKPINRIIGFKDYVSNKDLPYDDNGHGTHVSGIIAANGYSSRGKYTGVAPKSNILSIKALDKNGSGNTSDIIDAISYVIETKDKYNTKILNLSLGTPANNSSKNDPLSKAVEEAIKNGIIVIAAAGNSGPREGTILSPGINQHVITVGAVDDKRTIDPTDDTIATFSSRGPTNEGINKPDIVAPGVNINSLSNTNLNGYISLSGTSMATPLVSGSVALLLNKYGNMSQRDVKNMIIKSCIDLKDDEKNQGYGMLNLKSLFDDGNKNNKKIRECRQGLSLDLEGNILEGIIMILVILFLLDSRI